MIPIISFTVFLCVLNEENKMEVFLLRLSNIVIVLGVVSLIAYIGGIVLGVLNADTVTLYRNGHYYSIRSYFNFTYIGQEGVFLGRDVYRNTGIFLESPGWIFPLSLSVYIELFIRKETKIIRILILVITAITTYSTKGFIIIPFLLLAWFYRDSERRKSSLRAVKKILLPIVYIVFGLIVYYLLQNKSVDGSVSFSQRMEDMGAALKVWGNYLLLGCGYGNLVPFELYLSAQSSSSITSGLLKVFAQCGIYIGVEVIYLISLIYTRTPQGKKYEAGCLIILYSFYLITSSTWTNTLLILILAMGLGGFRRSEVQHKDEI